VRSGEKLGAAGEALTRAMGDGVAVDGLFADVLADKGRIAELAGTMDVSPQMISLLLYLAVKPSLEAGARQLATRLTGGQENYSGCPVCGSAPIIGELDAEGGQWVHCGLCWHRWPVKRLACPFCHNRDSHSLEYLYSEDEPEYRVNLCGGCRRYLKVVDTLKMNRGFYPPLEQVASIHLDMLATEKGYSHAAAPTISTVE
jgi:FdhE protein